jgi:hypothetical protein
MPHSWGAGDQERPRLALFNLSSVPSQRLKINTIWNECHRNHARRHRDDFVSQAKHNAEGGRGKGGKEKPCWSSLGEEEKTSLCWLNQRSLSLSIYDSKPPNQEKKVYFLLINRKDGMMSLFWTFGGMSNA